MTPSRPGLATPYRWLSEALRLCRAHLSLFLVAASTMLLFALLPALLLSAGVLPRSVAVQAGVYVLFSLVLLPPVTGGFYRLADAAQRGQAVRPAQIFDVIGDGPAFARLVLVNLLFSLLLLFGVVMPLAAIGGAPLLEWMRLISSLPPDARALPPMPEGVAPLLGGAALVMVLINTAKELAMAQAALSARSPLDAVGDGLRVTLRHAGAFLLFYVPVAIAAVVGFFVLALLAVLVGAVLSLVAAPLAYLVIMPVAMGVALGYYALVFAFFYRAWRDTLGGGGTADADAGAPPPPPTHGIEV